MGIIHYIPVIFVRDMLKTTYCTVLFNCERSCHFEDTYANYTQKLKQNHFTKRKNAICTDTI